MKRVRGARRVMAAGLFVVLAGVPPLARSETVTVPKPATPGPVGPAGPTRTTPPEIMPKSPDKSVIAPPRDDSHMPVIKPRVPSRMPVIRPQENGKATSP